VVSVDRVGNGCDRAAALRQRLGLDDDDRAEIVRRPGINRSP
jgi:hypothetical protein